MMPNDDIGIVLSGGGIRGIAHIGVLRALSERGIRPAHVAGASAGAIVGALYAAGYTHREMLDFFETKNPFRFFNMSITKPGLIDTEKVRANFEEYFPADSFESLGPRLRVVATDLMCGDAVVFDSGPLISPILASSSYPLMFSPVEIDGRLYADGGIVNNFPVGLLEGRCKFLLGVHAGEVREMKRGDFGNALAVAKRALEVGIFRKSSEKYERCSVVIRPPNLSRFGVFETKHNDEIEAIGYKAAVDRMPEILRALGR